MSLAEPRPPKGLTVTALKFQAHLFATQTLVAHPKAFSDGSPGEVIGANVFDQLMGSNGQQRLAAANSRFLLFPGTFGNNPS